MQRTLVFFILLIFNFSISAQNLTIYTEEDPPLNYLDSNSRLTGLSVEIVREIQRRVANSDPIQLVPWVRGLNCLNSGPLVMLFSMGRTAERNEAYQWIGPIYENTYLLYSLATASFQLNNLDEARQLRSIGVYNNDIRDQILSTLGFTNLSRQVNNESLIRMLFAGRLDAIAASKDGIGPLVKKAGHSIEEVREQLSFLTAQLYIGVSLDTPESIVQAWNEALNEMRSDATLLTIFQTYQLEDYYPGPAITAF